MIYQNQTEGITFECASSPLEGTDGKYICSQFEEGKTYKIETFGVKLLTDHDFVVDVNEVR